MKRRGMSWALVLPHIIWIGLRKKRILVLTIKLYRSSLIGSMASSAKKYSCKGKLSEKNNHARQETLNIPHWPKKNSCKGYINETNSRGMKIHTLPNFSNGPFLKPWRINDENHGSVEDLGEGHGSLPYLLPKPTPAGPRKIVLEARLPCY